jgi:hypothetical protein
VAPPRRWWRAASATAVPATAAVAHRRLPGFPGPFVQIVTGATMIVAFGDDQTALVMYNTPNPCR